MVTWHSSRLSPKPVTVTTHSCFQQNIRLRKASHLPPLCPAASRALAVKNMGTGLYTPVPAMVQLIAAHGPARGTRSSQQPSPAGENQGGFPTWAQLGSAAEPSSHASRIIPRDFLQCVCDSLWPLGVHSQGLKSTLIAGTFPEVQVPLIPHRIPAIPRKLNPAEPMEAPLPGSPE